MRQTIKRQIGDVKTGYLFGPIGEKQSINLDS